MNPKTFFFVSGLPRAGSTLLCNVLAQNPRFHVTATSGIMDVMFGVRNQWDQLAEFRAAIDKEANEAAKRRVLRAILDAYYADVDKPIVFDKSRSWLAHLEMAEHVLGEPVKVLVPVRDLRDVLASFEKLWRRAAASKQIAQESKFYFDFQTLEGRLNVWTRPDQPVGLAYNRVKDALQRGFGDRMHFVRYEQFTETPQTVMDSIYSFLNVPAFKHDFEHVEQVTLEDDRVHGFTNLHNIRPKIEPIEPQWPQVLGQAANRFAGTNVW